MNHLDEVTGAVWPAMQVTLLGGAAGLFTPGRARYVACAWSQRGKDWIELLDNLLLAADHHAVTSLQSPDAAARSHVHIVDSLRREFLGAPDIVYVIGISAVDQNVLCFKMVQKIRNSFVHDRRGNHQPDRARLRELLHTLRERGGANGFLLGRPGNHLRRPVQHHASM